MFMQPGNNQWHPLIVSCLEPLRHFLGEHPVVAVFGGDRSDELARRAGAAIGRAGCHLLTGGADRGAQAAAAQGFAGPGGRRQLKLGDPPPGRPCSIGLHPAGDGQGPYPTAPTLDYVYYTGLGTMPLVSARQSRNTLNVLVCQAAVVLPGSFNSGGTTNELAWLLHLGKPWIYLGPIQAWTEHRDRLQRYPLDFPQDWEGRADLRILEGISEAQADNIVADLLGYLE